jgi:hypothetical protein
MDVPESSTDAIREPMHGSYADVADVALGLPFLLRLADLIELPYVLTLLQGVWTCALPARFNPRGTDSLYSRSEYFRIYYFAWEPQCGLYEPSSASLQKLAYSAKSINLDGRFQRNTM